jgi:hypothetical protein
MNSKDERSFRKIALPMGNDRIVDLRGKHPSPAQYERKRRPAAVSGVTLHQTACIMSDKPSRWYTLNAHEGVTRHGLAYIVNDPVDFIWHANGLSRQTIGIEICGTFPGIEGDLSTLWGDDSEPSSLTDDMITAFDQLMWWNTQWFTDNHVSFENIFAHRQSSDTRRSDPGSEIWKTLALPWMRTLGIDDGGDGYKRPKHGRPIPREWNSKYTSKY